MKRKSRSSHRCMLAAGRLLLGLAIFLGYSAGAANPVVNGDFANPLSFGAVNWTVVYVTGGPGDFAVKGRTTHSRHGGTTGYGGHFRPAHDGVIHAYFKQTVSGLTPNGVYAVTNWLAKPADGDEAWYSKVHVYGESVGGLGSVLTAEATTTYQSFVTTNKADGNGEIELRLHFDRTEASAGDKWMYIHAWYDDVSMGLVSAPIVTNPPYKIRSFSLAGETATWTWESISNRLYNIQASPDLSNWSTFHANLSATGTNLTFTTNVSLSNPQYFRIHRP